MHISIVIYGIMRALPLSGLYTQWLSISCCILAASFDLTTGHTISRKNEQPHKEMTKPQSNNAAESHSSYLTPLRILSNLTRLSF